jgi:soluble lytic murein transglycosylase-like protein
MANTNRTRYLLAAQKVRVKTDPVPTPEAPKLTAEQRRAMYAPKSALEIIPKRPPMPIRAAKKTAKASGVGLAMLTAIVGGIMIGETKKGLYS